MDEQKKEPTGMKPIKEWALSPGISVRSQPEKPFVETPVHMFAGKEKTDRWKQGLGILKGKEAHFQTGSYRLREDQKKKKISKLNQRRSLGSDGAPRDLLMHASE